MERLTNCAQGYCEMYCKKYGHCFEDPDDCIFKDEIKMYDALKSIEGIVPFDRLLELADADRAGLLVVLPCKVGDAAYWLHNGIITECRVHRIQMNRTGLFICLKSKVSHGAFRVDICLGKTVFLTREEAEAALKGGDLPENRTDRR